MAIEVLTVLLRACCINRWAAVRGEFDQSMPIVAGAEQIPNRRNSLLNSRAQIFDGSGGARAAFDSKPSSSSAPAFGARSRRKLSAAMRLAMTRRQVCFPTCRRWPPKKETTSSLLGEWPQSAHGTGRKRSLSSGLFNSDTTLTREHPDFSGRQEHDRSRGTMPRRQNSKQISPSCSLHGSRVVR